MEYLLSNICTNNYWNPTTIVEIIVGGGWYLFETQCKYQPPTDPELYCIHCYQNSQFLTYHSHPALSPMAQNN